MTKLEHSKVWAKHKAALEKAPAKQQEEHEKLSKKDKGLAASAWLLEKEGKKFMSALKKVSAQETVTRRDKWETKLQMLQKFSQDELERHLASGRIIPELLIPMSIRTWLTMRKWSRVRRARNGPLVDLEKFLKLYNTEAVSDQLVAQALEKANPLRQRAEMQKGLACLEQWRAREGGGRR